MSLTFTTDEKNALKSGRRPEFDRKATIIKEPYNADLRESIDISEHVESWGTLKLANTLVYRAWEMPNLTITVVNQNNFFTETHAESVWQYGPEPTTPYSLAVDPRECHLLIQVYLLMYHGSDAVKLLEYRGRIDDVIPRRDDEYAVSEIVTLMEQAKNLRERVTKESREHWIVGARSW